MADYQVGNLKLASEFFNVFIPQSGPLNTIADQFGRCEELRSEGPVALLVLGTASRYQ